MDISYPGLNCFDGSDNRVLQFIYDFVHHEGEDNQEVISHLFRAGYCYYFAEILKNAFHRGQICLAYPFGHIVWLDGSDEDKDIAYDIEGVCDNYEHLIPISYLRKTIQDFKHVPGEDCYADEIKCEEIYKRYLRDRKRRKEKRTSLILGLTMVGTVTVGAGFHIWTAKNIPYSYRQNLLDLIDYIAGKNVFKRTNSLQ